MRGQLVPVGETRGRAAPEDTKSLIKTLSNTELGSTKTARLLAPEIDYFTDTSRTSAPNTSTGSVL